MEMSEVNIQIDGQALRVAPGTTVLQAAEEIGIIIPRYCYHPAFAPEGSCRMCLVEIEGLPKLDLACSTVVREGMKVWTKTPKVLQARKDILAFFLADHPLDCPICDKAGECLLQEYYDQHGQYPSRFLEPKEKKEKLIPIGKRLLLDRERCVLCSRCVRFLRQVTKTGELGIFERGIKAEVGIDEGVEIRNNYSGNLIDICPVGAITDGDFRFKTRVWFMKNGKTICPRCSRGCAVIVQWVDGYPLRGNERKIYRIVAAPNPEVNGHWICDFGRYGYHDIEDGRLTSIVVNGQREGLQSPNWENALKALAGGIRGPADAGRGNRLAVVLNASLTDEELSLARRLFVDALGVRQVFFADPPEGEDDGYLLTKERAPNLRGAAAAGFTPVPADPARLAGSADVVLVFGASLAKAAPRDEWTAALAKIGGKYLVTPHRTELDSAFDVLLPAALWVEKRGTFTNVQGLRQSFEPILPLPGGALPESEILVRLASGLGVKLE
jgi:NADH-quinone oxidoreductase subunit G